MRQGVLHWRFGIAIAVVLAIGLVGAPVLAQEQEGAALFPRSSATIILSDSGLSISPEQPGPGPVSFTVENRSDTARGVVVTGKDLVGTPILRYSARVLPGETTKMEFWLYQGNTYTFRDYTSRRAVGRGWVFKSTYSHRISVPTPIPLGRGPRFELRRGTIDITRAGIRVTPSRSDLGPIVFTVRNRTNRPRGVVITGEDRANSLLFRYSRLVRPGGVGRVYFWLYEGKTYMIRDYMRRIAPWGLPGRAMIPSTELVVNPGSPAGLGAGPEMKGYE